MPFGPKCEYKDFDDCVRKNSGMKSPEGYCARIQEMTEKHCAERTGNAHMNIVRNNARVIAGYKARLIERISALDPHLAQGLRGIKLGWYHILNVNDNDDEETEEVEEATAEVFIYDEIGGSFGVDAAEFVKDLSAITAPSIKVRINSPGGSVFDSIAIYNALVMHPAYITTYVDSLAASGASIVAMAGDECVMMVGSQLMIHDALGVEMGNAADMRAMADFLDQQSMNIATIYANKAGGEATDWRALMLAETWFGAQEAVDAGLSDTVYKPPPKQETGKKPVSEEDEKKKDDEEHEHEEGMPMPMEDEEAIDEIVSALMQTQHRLTNRGYKYPGRRRAPTPRPPAAHNRRTPPAPMAIDDAELEKFIAAFTKTLGR